MCTPIRQFLKCSKRIVARPRKNSVTLITSCLQVSLSGLFVIQVLCLIAAFFLVFASAAMIYGIHTWSKYLVWPWFPVMLSSILATLAYCIMWWCGDVRSYWLAITIIEIIVVFINVSARNSLFEAPDVYQVFQLRNNIHILQIYCVVVVMMYYRRINATTDEYEGKDRRGVRYKINRMGNSRRDLLDSYGTLNVLSNF